MALSIDLRGSVSFPPGYQRGQTGLVIARVEIFEFETDAS
jgi:hypothetical protein